MATQSRYLQLNSYMMRGEVATEPELVHTVSGYTKCRLRLRVWVQSKTDPYMYITVNAWENLAAYASQFIKKGALVHVVGEIHPTVRPDQETGKRIQTSYYVKANELILLIDAPEYQEYRERMREKNKELRGRAEARELAKARKRVLELEGEAHRQTRLQQFGEPSQSRPQYPESDPRSGPENAKTGISGEPQAAHQALPQSE